MKKMPFSFQSEGVSELATAAASYWSSEIKQRALQSREPCSVLNNHCSLSPPTSSSTSLTGGGSVGASSDSTSVAALSGNNPTATATKWPRQPSSTADKKEGWAPVAVGGGGALDDWEAVISAGSRMQEQTFLHWIMGDIDESSKPPLPSPLFPCAHHLFIALRLVGELGNVNKALLDAIRVLIRGLGF